LLRALEEEGALIRCIARNPEALRRRAGPDTQVVEGDVLDPTSLEAAMRDVDTAYYLVHSMGSTGDFEDEDRRAARLFGQAANAAGVRRIVYLGGLGSGSELSPHLHSRHEVGEILRQSGVPTIELRASIIIGSGSLSFEMIRALTEKLPVMVTPRWVRVPAQPIAIEDVIDYLLAARHIETAGSQVFEIGGADRVSYADIMREYARQRGLRRAMIPVPVLSPRLSGLWLGLVTPIYARVGRKLVDSLRNPTVVEDERALSAFAVRPRGIAQAIARALRNEDRAFAETRWCDALSAAGSQRQCGGVRFGSRIVDSRSRDVAVSPPQAFEPISRLGGDTGWYYGDWLWRLRGFLDLLVGGVGARRGRRDPGRVQAGDTVDFWRVERVEAQRLLLLSAEMKLPGRAWLQFEVEPKANGALIRQTAIFDPLGLVGLLYWYTLYPIHTLVFDGMLRGIARAAQADTHAPPGAPVTTDVR
jgi:uncharacterized protein YbjT (DUF2867 family)